MSDFERILIGDLILSEGVIEGGYLAIRDGRIAEVGRGKAPAAKAIDDFRGCWIVPGVVDGQVHTGSQANQEGLGMGSRAAAAGGVTTIVDMPYDEPVAVTSAGEFRKKVDVVERESHVDVALHATIAPEDGLEEIPGLIEAGACAFKFSTFEAHPTRFPRITDDVLYEAFRRIAPSGVPCGVHNQDQEISLKNINRMIAGGDTDWDAWGRALPTLVEDLATARVYELGALTGARAHAVHVSTSRGFALRNMYRAAGHQATVETCVQYLMLNEEEHASRFKAKTKHYPPIRPKAEVERLWTHIAAGDCDFVSSDHVSWGLERKGDPSIFKNAAGGPGLETLLPAMMTGCEEHGVSPCRAVELLAENPARHFRLPGKGRLARGYDADIVVLERGRFPFDPANSLSAVTWSAFEGREFTVRVQATFVRGVLAWDGARVVNEPACGRFVRPSIGQEAA